MYIANRYSYISICYISQELDVPLFLGVTADLQLRFRADCSLEACHLFPAVGVGDDQTQVIHQQFGREV